jgi:hypothetical protein
MIESHWRRVQCLANHGTDPLFGNANTITGNLVNCMYCAMMSTGVDCQMCNSCHYTGRKCPPPECSVGLSVGSLAPGHCYHGQLRDPLAAP